MSQSAKSKNPSQPSNMQPSRLINLPKLDRIIVRNNGSYKSPSAAYHPNHQIDRKHIDVSNLLKIEGKNNNPKYDQKYDEPKKVLDRDLKAELRRIYNIKPSPTR